MTLINVIPVKQVKRHLRGKLSYYHRAINSAKKQVKEGWVLHKVQYRNYVSTAKRLRSELDKLNNMKDNHLVAIDAYDNLVSA